MITLIWNFFVTSKFLKDLVLVKLININDQHMISLCNSFDRLRSLKLYQLGDITDDAFRLLHNLITIDINNCQHITTKFFSHLTSSVSLCNLEFDAKICCNVADTDDVETDVLFLHQIPTLQKISIFVPFQMLEDFRVLRLFCKGKRWILNLEQHCKFLLYKCT